MANRPIPVSEANQMIKLYLDYMTGLGVDMNKQTTSVSFSAPELLDWMATVKPYTDEFRIFNGVYPQGHTQAGRITSIIWPYKDDQPATKPVEEEGKGGGSGNPIPPFNDGHTRP
jgi:hypothetical protein